MIDVAPFTAHWEVALPGIIVAATALFVMAVDALARGSDREVLAGLGIAGVAAAGVAAISLWSDAPVVGFGDTLRADGYGLFFTLLVCAGSLLTLLMSVDFLREQPLPAGEYHALVLLSTAGMIFLAAANDLIVIFLAIEIMSVAVYVLAGLFRRDARSTEAALKYFLLGAFATGFLLYGIAFFYAAAGSTRLDVIARAIAHDGLGPFALLGIALVLVGFGFKVALIPFHVWTPDVYEGAPTAVTAFMAVGVKAAAFAAFARVFTMFALGGVAATWTGLLWVLAALTMTVGNVTAVMQRSVKRMLAYSSIAHAGYALVGLVAATRDGGAALLFYLATYLFMTLGAFAVLIALGRRGEPNEDLADWAGVGFRQPVLGLSMAVFMLSLAGIPPTAGFVGKFYLFSAAIDAGYVGLAVIGVLNGLVSVYYYLGVLVAMYMAEGGPAVVRPSTRPYLLATILVSVAATLLIGILPAAPMDLARAAFLSLR